MISGWRRPGSWASSRFPLVEGHNSAAVDLFPVRHAEKVLAAFGRAFAALPDAPVSLGPRPAAVHRAGGRRFGPGGKGDLRAAGPVCPDDERPPLDAGVAARGGRRAGVGATFLEETFSAAGAPPEHRYHQKAARAILKALLAQLGNGHQGAHAFRGRAPGRLGIRRPTARLRELASHSRRRGPRLITPTDPEGKDEVGRLKDEGRKWRLTSKSLFRLHPSLFILPSGTISSRTITWCRPLRDWLNRKLRETRRGRAELRLADRTALWSGQPENRFLPPWWEWLALRLLTRPRDWTTPQRTMMRRAARYYTAWSLLVAAGVVLLLLVGGEVYGRHRAQVLQDRLLGAATEDVADIVREMGPYRRWLDAPLRDAYASAAASRDSSPTVARQSGPAAGKPGTSWLPPRPLADRTCRKKCS